MTAAVIEHTATLCALGVEELGRRYRAGSLSPVAVTRATLQRITALNPALNAFISVLEEPALAAAEAAAALLRAGIDLGPLQGVPFSVKDLMQVAGTRTTAASRQRLQEPLDIEDATVVRRLRQAGAVLIGKTNLHEFASGQPDEHGPFGWVQNPRRHGYQSGSSSSGAGAATAAGLGVIALGTDTGGSIRLPAIACGVTGLKPTYGRVPVRGVLPLSVYLDHVGPLARSVADCAHALQVIAGYDPDDPYSSPQPLDGYVAALQQPVDGLRVGMPANAFYREASADTLAVFDAAVAALPGLGLILRELQLPRVEETPALTQFLFQADGAAYHERYRGREELYDQGFRDFILGGREHLAVPYVQARQAMAEISALWRGLFERVDVLITPAAPVTPAPHGVTEVELNGEPQNYRQLFGRFTRAFNLSGFPALTMPAGRAENGLPISVQLVAPPFAEARLLAVAQALETRLGLAPPALDVDLDS